MTSTGTPGQGKDEIPDETATRRSWYVSAAAADELAGAVNDLHYELRSPKHIALAAIIRTGLAHMDEVRDRVSRPEAYPPASR